MKTNSIIKGKSIILSILLYAMLSSCTTVPDVHQWRGDNRDGKYTEENLLNEWPENGPDLVWSADGLGKGYAAPVVTEDRIFINGEIDSISYLFALDLEGNVLWKAENGPQFMGEGFSATYPGARSTPTVVEDMVYAISGTGRILCCTTGGEVLWTKDMVNDLDGYLPYFGIAESPLIDGDKLFCYPSGQANNIMALDRMTGETIWASKAVQDTASFCSPILIELEERKLMVTMSHYYLQGIDVENGELAWKYFINGYEAEGDHCNTPVFYKGDIYQVYGDRKSDGAVKLELSEDGSEVTELWTNDKVKNNFSGFIIHDDLLFTTIRGNDLKVLELDGGTVVDSMKVPTGAMIFNQDKFITYGYNGEVHLLNYTDGKLQSGGSFKVEEGSGQHFSHPVLANGVMYIRHGDVLMSYKISE